MTLPSPSSNHGAKYAQQHQWHDDGASAVMA
jgi:hypothetical protein